jgi:AraC family L-rhamnose operon regulatory protein RhaS
MDLSVIGRQNLPGYELNAYVDNDEKFIKDIGLNQRFCFVLFQEGFGILSVNGKRLLATAPSILCLNEREQRELVQNNNLKAHSIYFHPCVVNGSFNFENIQDIGSFEGVSRMDLDWFLPFIERDESYNGVINIGPITAQRLANLMEYFNNELSIQKDNYWPCRSRSFFIEILVQIYRIYLERDKLEGVKIESSDSDIDQVITYINVNYANKITIAVLESIFHINRTTLNEKFNKVTGMTINKFIVNLRARIACTVLRDTTLPIEEIVERTGFNDTTHFCRVIKKYTGCTPTEYRTKFCWMYRNRNPY